MIRYLEHKYIDYSKWDFCLSKSSNNLVYANSWYLNLVCDDWDALVLNDYDAIMPLPKRKKWGVCYIYQPFFCQQLGVFSNDNNLEVDSFLESIPTCFKYVRLNLNSENISHKYCIKENINYLLELEKIEKLELFFSDNTKRNLRKSQGQNMIVEELLDVEDLDCFINKFSKIPSDILKDYKSFLCKSNKKESFKHYGVFLSDRLLASVFIVENQDRIIYLNGVVNEIGKKNGAMHYLFQYLFQLYEGKTFDFEGSNIEGVARFYKGFGAKPKPYQTIKIDDKE